MIKSYEFDRIYNILSSLYRIDFTTHPLLFWIPIQSYHKASLFSYSRHFWLDIRHFVSSSWCHSILVIHDYAISESYRSPDFSNSSFDIERFSRKCSIWVVLRDVQRHPFAPLFRVEGKNSQRGRQVCPGGQCTTMHTPNRPTITMEIIRFIIFL